MCTVHLKQRKTKYKQQIILDSKLETYSVKLSRRKLQTSSTVRDFSPKNLHNIWLYPAEKLSANSSFITTETTSGFGEGQLRDISQTFKGKLSSRNFGRTNLKAVQALEFGENSNETVDTDGTQILSDAYLSFWRTMLNILTSGSMMRKFIQFQVHRESFLYRIIICMIVNWISWSHKFQSFFS